MKETCSRSVESEAAAFIQRLTCFYSLTWNQSVKLLPACKRQRFNKPSTGTEMKLETSHEWYRIYSIYTHMHWLITQIRHKHWQDCMFNGLFTMFSLFFFTTWVLFTFTCSLINHFSRFSNKNSKYSLLSAPSMQQLTAFLFNISLNWTSLGLIGQNKTLEVNQQKIFLTWWQKTLLVSAFQTWRFQAFLCNMIVNCWSEDVSL